MEAVLALMNSSSAEYALISSVKEMLGNISALLQSSRWARSETGDGLVKILRTFFNSLSCRLSVRAC